MPRKTLFIIFFITSSVFAQNYLDCVSPLWHFQNSGSTNRALASNTTVHNSSSFALNSNPAILALEKNKTLTLSFNNNNFNSSSKFNNSDFTASSSNSDKNVSTGNLDGLSLVIPVNVYQGSLAFGFSYSRIGIFNSAIESSGMTLALVPDGSEYISDAPVSSNIYYTNSGQMNTYRFGFGLEFQKNLFIGTSMNFYSGKQTHNYEYSDTDVYDYFWEDETNKKLKVTPDYSGINFNFGLVYSQDFINLGFNFTSPFKLHTTEKYSEYFSQTYDATSSDSDTSYTSTDKRTFKISAPSTFSVGLELLFEHFSLIGDMKYQNWRNMEFSSNLLDHDETKNEYTKTEDRVNEEIRDELDATIEFGLGLSTVFLDIFDINLGYRIIALPYHNLSKDEDNINLLGMGIDTQVSDYLKLGFSYQYEFGKNTIDNSFFQYPIYRKYNSQNLTLTASFLF